MRNSDIAYEKLRMMIVTAELKPGDVLVESKLQETLQIGHTPIREALNRLCWDGFVKIIPRRSILVNEVSLNEVDDVYRLRLALTPLESEMAVLHRTEKDLNQLRKILEELKRETEQKKRALLDRDFHRAISAMSGNTFLERDMNTYQDLSIRLLFLNQNNLSEIDDMTSRDHEEMYQCLLEQDDETLTEIQKSHIIAFRNKFIRSI